MSNKPRILIVAGYFDWFSGYQETALSRALVNYCDVTVVASDRVNPIFTDQHLGHIGVSRRYKNLDCVEHGVRVRRFRSLELRSMLVSTSAIRHLMAEHWDAVIQAMPGQVLPAFGNLASPSSAHVVLYGDNSAMYANLSTLVAGAKRTMFYLTKGPMYWAVNRKADVVYGYTPNTQKLIDRIPSRSECRLLPLSYDQSAFFYSDSLREETRRRFGFDESDFVVVAPGKPQKQKKLDELLEFFDASCLEDQTVRLVFAGLGSDDASNLLRRKAETAKYRDSITLLPFIDSQSLNELFNAADLGIWPAMPAITIQQAMGTGLPVLIPNNDILRHLIKSDSQGTFLKSFPGDLAAVVESARGNVASGPHLRRHNRAQAAWLSNDGIARSVIKDALPHLTINRVFEDEPGPRT